LPDGVLVDLMHVVYLDGIRDGEFELLGKHAFGFAPGKLVFVFAGRKKPVSSQHTAGRQKRNFHDG
jgi:hypothetical protein